MIPRTSIISGEIGTKDGGSMMKKLTRSSLSTKLDILNKTDKEKSNKTSAFMTKNTTKTGFY
jgi:hypothetical protein